MSRYSMTEVDFSSIGMRRSYGDNYAFLNQFVDKHVACVEVTNYQHNSAAIAARCLNVSAERAGLKHIKAITRKGKLYLINTLLTNKD